MINIKQYNYNRYLVGRFFSAKVDHVLNLGRHSTGDVTRVAAANDVTKVFVVLQVQFRNNSSLLKAKMIRVEKGKAKKMGINNFLENDSDLVI